jgi:2,5-diketo-D-gluconate reductase A
LEYLIIMLRDCIGYELLAIIHLILPAKYVKDLISTPWQWVVYFGLHCQIRKDANMRSGNGIVPSIQLNNGVEIPQIGLGVWQAQQGDEVIQAVTAALDAGYRLIDTAAIYGNEAGVGQAIRRSEVPREQLFITSKLWNDRHQDAEAAFQETLQRLGLDYLDLYLIHWPVPRRNTALDAWRSLEKLLHSGQVRAIGVSNFTPAHLEALLQESQVTPAVNQIELHPRFQQSATRQFCAERGIAIEAYSPLMHGGDILDNPVIQQLAAAYSKTPAQIVLRWHIQHGFVVIPKSVNPERIMENIDVFDFALSPEDMQQIDSLDTEQRIGADPDTATF